MSALLTWTIVFVVSLFVLIKSADFFTTSAEKIGLYLGLPAFIVGVTITAVGTSIPELVSSIVAVLKGSSEIVMGNVVGSNIANIFLVLAITAIVGKKLVIDFELINVDLPLLVGSAFLLALTMLDGIFTLPEAIFSLAGFFVYIAYTVSSEKIHDDKEIKKEVKKEFKGTKFDPNSVIVLLVSCFFIYLGAKYTIESVIQLSSILNVGTEIIAISAIAIGTSLPELVVTLSAAKKNNPEMAVGNILGSCIFNALAVTGISGLFGVLVVSDVVLIFALPVMVIATLLFLFMAEDKEITLWEGWFLLLFYAFFIGKLFNLF